MVRLIVRHTEMALACARRRLHSAPTTRRWAVGYTPSPARDTAFLLQPPLNRARSVGRGDYIAFASFIPHPNPRRVAAADLCVAGSDALSVRCRA
ncbi:hypothetical protein BJI67_13655 [Acidihalobacter aeolianus]|uniref:Uncharacterized protein n=1 Tax=Acidihalobacter aeolianus TaxID=2792603 RepID=A0A1D8KAJ2_9GAMM|nr:hypothetical protein BJI67_13655 [Acidihalobacter aeolianus]